MTKRSRFAATLVVLATPAVAIALAADDPPRREPAPSATHLVGHEDAPLLLRVQDVIDDWDPRKLRNPYVDTLAKGDRKAKLPAKKSPRRRDLGDFVADFDAAEALGKAFFWEMKAGSDYRRRGGKGVGTACASCHYRYGADARDTHTTRIPYVAWDKYGLDPDHKDLGYNEKPRPFPVADLAKKAVKKAEDLYLPRSRPRHILPDDEEIEGDDDNDARKTPLSLIVGSQGVEPRIFRKVVPDPGGGADWKSEVGDPKEIAGREHELPEWSMFLKDQADGNQLFRQITPRNSPSIVNAAFADRLFHDGRAESTFNGISIFGDFDDREALYISAKPGDRPVLVRLAIAHAALASQAVGPIVNDVEMSYAGRTFHDLAVKLLDAEVLGDQQIHNDDSLLGTYKALGLAGPGSSYRKLIRRAFRREWWDGSDGKGGEHQVTLMLAEPPAGQPRPLGTLMQANFSLYWGLSIMLYEASLVSNNSPFDRMMMGDGEGVDRLWKAKKAELEPIYIDRARTKVPPPDGESPFPFKSGSEVFQRGFRAFLGRGCVECHDGPLMSEIYARTDFAGEAPPIAATMDRTLLTNSRGDAIAIAIREEYDRMIARVSARLAASTADPLAKRQADRAALSLGNLIDRSGGRQGSLSATLEALFKSPGFPFPQAPAAAIAGEWIAYEKTAVRHSGNRTFFGEAERIAAAEALIEPVGVERMAFPPDQAQFRRPLPIRGPLVDEAYAFYDGSFYNLGVSPPRYDRGNGTWTEPDGDGEPPPAPVALDTAAEVAAVVQGIEARESALPAAEKSSAARIAEAVEKEVTSKRGLYVTRSGMEQLERDLKAGAMKEYAGASGKLRDLAAAVRQARGNDRTQDASGAPGRAYRLRKSDRPAPPPAPEAAQQAAPGPRMVDRDVSWYRDLPRWDADFPRQHPDHPAAQYKSVDKRRSDVHFFSRARSLAQDESPWGHRKPLLHDNELAFWGAFKTPTLRNVELTPPYMHNGRILSLIDVVDFYDRGGDVAADRELNPDKHPAMVRLDLNEDDKFALVFFLMCLTDDRVREEKGPFDHPSIAIANGYDEGLQEKVFSIPAVGEGGRPCSANRTFPRAD